MSRKKILTLAAVAALFLLLGFHALEAAWVVDETETFDGFTNHVILTFGKNVIRADNFEQQSTMLLDFNAGMVFMLIHPQRAYLEIPVQVLSEQARQIMVMSEKGAGPTKVELKSTKEKQAMNGYKCEKYAIVANDVAIGEIWLTPEIKDPNLTELYGRFLDLIGAQEVQRLGGWLNGMKKALQIGFPIRVVVPGPEGKTATMEFKPSQKNDIDPSVFQVPKDYSKMAPPPGMMGAPPGGQPPPPPGGVPGPGIPPR